MPADDIGRKVGADPITVSTWLKKHGVDVHKGLHRKMREPPKLSPELKALLGSGPDSVLKFLDERVWGIAASQAGMKQLTKFCRFLGMPLTVGRNETASTLGIDRSMVKAWTDGTKQPYLVRAAGTVLRYEPRPGWKMLPLHLDSGGNYQGPWIQVPCEIRGSDEIAAVVKQLTPLESTYVRGERFGLSREQLDVMKEELFGYLLGILVGDAGKLGGMQNRFASSNIDLHLTLKKSTNECMGDFVCMCANSLGIKMDRKRDKSPTGRTALAKEPSASYRWTSDRSPLIAWSFNAGLGLKWGECTTLNPLKMEWIFKTTELFRIRFLQGVADSDGSVKPYDVFIASVPNADLVARILQSLGMTTAHVGYEGGKPYHTIVCAREALTLPVFSEFVRSYRYERLFRHLKN